MLSSIEGSCTEIQSKRKQSTAFFLLERQDTLIHQFDTVYSRGNERFKICHDLPKHESRYSMEYSRDNMSGHLIKNESSFSRQSSRDLSDPIPKNESSYGREYSRDWSDPLPKYESRYSRKYNRDWSDHLPKHKSGYSQVSFQQDNQEKTKGKKSGNSREKKRDTKYEDDMNHRYDSSRENNSVKVSAFRSSSESDQSERGKCYRRKDSK
ncbi:hypothetical protein BgiBS90_034264 [Biomphalaria glabrata]|nr:hypothetical protein BgiBS90_034264 [Biomphalaria glabrata]